MKRKLTAREWMLIGVLAILLLVVLYIVRFYTPVTAERDSALIEAENYRNQIEAAQRRLAEKQRMEQELEEIFARDPDPLGLPDYDNLKPIMVELNAILSATEKYSLSFGTANTSNSIVRREISISFTCVNYSVAKEVLQRLHDSKYRCMLNNLSINRGKTEGDSASVSGNIVYFECLPQ